jgi:hypothetical protein
VLPGQIKRDYLRHISRMTDLYTMTLCLGAALAAGLTVPLRNLSGGSWQAALGFWATPALLAGLAWAWTYRAGTKRTTRQACVPNTVSAPGGPCVGNSGNLSGAPPLAAPRASSTGGTAQRSWRTTSQAARSGATHSPGT